MKYYKILINITIWHLKPYKIKHMNISNSDVIEYGFLCFKFIMNN
jgi:hypothetical protein